LPSHFKPGSALQRFIQEQNNTFSKEDIEKLQMGDQLVSGIAIIIMNNNIARKLLFKLGPNHPTVP